MTISHDVVERAARVVLETNASVKILTAKHSNNTDGSPLRADRDAEPGEMVDQLGGTIKRYIGADGNEIMLPPPVVVSGSPLSHCELEKTTNHTRMTR